MSCGRVSTAEFYVPLAWPLVTHEGTNLLPVLAGFLMRRAVLVVVHLHLILELLTVDAVPPLVVRLPR